MRWRAALPARALLAADAGGFVQRCGGAARGAAAHLKAHFTISANSSAAPASAYGAAPVRRTGGRGAAAMPLIRRGYTHPSPRHALPPPQAGAKGALRAGPAAPGPSCRSGGQPRAPVATTHSSRPLQFSRRYTSALYTSAAAGCSGPPCLPAPHQWGSRRRHAAAAEAGGAVGAVAAKLGARPGANWRCRTSATSCSAGVAAAVLARLAPGLRPCIGLGALLGLGARRLCAGVEPKSVRRAACTWAMCCWWRLAPPPPGWQLPPWRRRGRRPLPARSPRWCARRRTG